MRLRFNHIFLSLMLGSGFCAFVVPVERSGKVRGWIDGFFAPVAQPVRRVAGAVSGRLQRPAGTGTGGVLGDGRLEIERLRGQVASLTMQIQHLRQLNANRELAGDAEKYSLPFRVIGGNPLLLQASAEDRLSPNMPVVYRDSLVGRVLSVGAAGAQVRLISDRGFLVNAAFGRFVAGENGAVQFAPIALKGQPLVEGAGNGLLSVNNLTLEQVEQAKLQANDWVVLADDEWPTIVQGFLIGTIEAIEPHPKAKLFAWITIRPKLHLGQLEEVMVVTGRLVRPAGPVPAKAAGPVPARGAAPVPTTAKSAVGRGNPTRRAP